MRNWIIAAVGLATVAGGVYYYMHSQKPQPAEWVEARDLTFTDTPAADLTVTTTTGAIEGKRDASGVLQFLGVPFAEAPVGDRRFAPPVAVTPWEGTLTAHDHGPRCMQAPSFQENWDGVQSEDCLWLNIVTPAADDAKRPVMVWTHGGGLYSGGAGEPDYDGRAFANRGDVVVVNLQYRLGTYGFIDLSEIGGDPNSGRLGYLDQLMALQWVNENIAQFGGDPDNITIFGESAGSYSTAAMALNPEAADLFHKVILMSGTYNSGTPKVSRAEAARIFMDHLNAETLDDLRSRTSLELLAAQEKLIEFAAANGSDLQLLLDPPRPTADMIHAFAAQGKPLLQGTTSHEARFFVSFSGGSGEKLAKGLYEGLGVSPDQIERLRQIIASGEPDLDEDAQYIRIVSAQQFFQAHDRFVEEYQTANPQVYAYVFDGDWPDYAPLEGAHAVDLQFTFNTLHSNDTEHQALSDKWQDALIAFAHTGDPNTGDIPNWPEFERDTLPFMWFSQDEIRLVSNPFPWMPEFGVAIEEILKPDIR